MSDFVYDPDPRNPVKGWAQAFMHYHPDVTREEANEAWNRLKAEGVDVYDPDTAYAAMHKYFSSDDEDMKIGLTVEQRRMAKDLGMTDREYAEGIRGIRQQKKEGVKL